MYSTLENPVSLGVAMCFVTFIISYCIYPLALRMARVWHIYDNPGERKLQKAPVPVFGGMVVFTALCTSAVIFFSIFYSVKLLWMLPAMAVLFVVGVLDDKFSLSPWVRLLFEIFVVLAIVMLNHNYIDNLNGIFGLWRIPDAVAIPLSVFAGVGIINSINLIDGVDGYSSGYSMQVCFLAAIVFYLSGIEGMAVLSLICVGALLTFFLHNVFGRTSKMFLGDGGALMIGVLIMVFCFSILKTDSFCFTSLLMAHGVGLVPMMLAFLSIAVFDTLRVMFARIFRGISPFHPDKTHMHHLFIDLGFSHFGTTFCLLTLNFLVIVCWLISWACGASVDVQMVVVLFFSIFNTFGLYSIIRRSQRRDGAFARALSSFGKCTSNWEFRPSWRWMSKLVDDNLFEEGKV